MRVIAPLAFALSIGALGACDSLGRSVLGGPGPVIPHDDGVVGLDAIDATQPFDVIDTTVPTDVMYTTDRSEVPVDCTDGQRAVSNVCVAEGLLTFTLTWDRPGDMDLHVVTPAGNEIYYSDRMFDDGTLDVDDRTGVGPENVYWTIPPAPGDYVVCVVPFAIDGPTNFVVTVRSMGMTVDTWIGSRAKSGTAACTSMAETRVGTYTVPPDVPDM